MTVLRCSSFLPLPSPHDRIKIRRSTVEKCTNARRRKRGWKPPSSGVARRDFSIRSRDSSFANFEFRTLLLFPPKTIQFSSFLNFYLINVIRFLLLLLEEINLSLIFRDNLINNRILISLFLKNDLKIVFKFLLRNLKFLPSIHLLTKGLQEFQEIHVIITSIILS